MLDDNLRDRFDGIRVLAEAVGAERVLLFLYEKFFSVKQQSEIADNGALPKLQRELSELEGMLSERLPQDFLTISRELGLRDIENVLLYTAGLRRRCGETVWLHYNLAMALNCLLLAGVEAARTPCLLHSFLGLRYQNGGRHHEPLL